MRELKFRVWDKDDVEYVDGVGDLYLDIVEVGTKVFCIQQICPGRYVIEQYTGLKDKNGKEIYEGDIVEYTTHYYGKEKRHRKAVEWGEWYSDDFGEPHNLGYFNLSECMEVIGNVHENKELLEGKK